MIFKKFIYAPLEVSRRLPGFKHTKQCTALFSVPVNENSKKSAVRRYGPLTFVHPWDYYRQYLLDNACEYPTLFVPKEVAVNSSKPVINYLCKLKANEVNDVKVMEEFNDLLKKDGMDLTYEELKELLYLFSNINFRLEKSEIQNAVKHIDDELFRRIKTFSNDEHIQNISLLCNSSIYNCSKYFWVKCTKFCNKPHWFDTKQLMHLLYILCSVKKFPAKESKFKFQNCLNDIIGKLNPTELGLLMFSLQRIKLNVSHSCLFKNIYNSVFSNIENVNDVDLTSICNGFRETGKGNSLRDYCEFQEKIINYVDNFSMATLNSVASVSNTFHKINEKFLNKLLGKAKSNIDNCSDFVIQSLICYLAKFNVRDDEFLRMAIVSMKKRENVSHVNYLLFGKGLICLDIFDEEVVGKILEKDFVAEIMRNGPNLVKIDLKFIDTAVELDMPDYMGPRLDKRNNLLIWRIGKFAAKKENAWFKNADYYLGKTESPLYKLYGYGVIHWKKIITCYPTTLVMRFDQNFNIQTLPFEYLKTRSIDNLAAPKDGHLWVSLNVLENSTRGVDDGTNCIARARNRHFEKLGYHVLTIDALQLMKERREGNAAVFLQNKMKEVFDQISVLGAKVHVSAK